MLMSDGGTIFAKTLVTDVLNAVNPKYDAAPLEGFLAQTFGDAMLDGIAKPELIVPTVDLLRPASIFFKSWRARKIRRTLRAQGHGARNERRRNLFRAGDCQERAGRRHRCVDGGTAINDPAIAAILEADALWQGEDLRVLSLGTGT